MIGGPREERGVVVTGGGRGIGAAAARRLARDGRAVVVAARSAHEVEAVAAGLRAEGARVAAIECDVADEAGVRKLGEAARGFLGSADILVHSAGASASAPFHRIALEDWNRMLSMNATSAFLCVREFLPAMIERGWGRIVIVASIAGLEGARYITHYSASKHAVVGLVRSLAAELAGTGVAVSALCPGYVDTPMTERTIENVERKAGLDRSGALAAVLKAAGQERLLLPDEVAAQVAVLCGNEARDVNGRVIVVKPEAAAS
ncbi:MAG: SDR family oxidoreductase [Candidatus Eiseniibacteriota bacterium]